MNSAALAEQIFDVLQEFDRLVQPFGWYSVRDVLLQPKPKEVVRDFANQVESKNEWQDIHQFCRIFTNIGSWGNSNMWFSSFAAPNFGSVSLKMVRTSKVKVRLYGSRYHLDKHENYSRRWDKLQLGEEILKLRTPRADNDWQMLLLLGFDKAQRPFERELLELKPHQTRATHDIEFFERTWDDSMGRGFKVKAALWAHHLK